MGDSNKQTCQLCLDKTPASECETIDETRKAMLEFLLININFDISEFAVVCTMCLKRLQESFDFKSRCSIIFGEADNKADVAKVFPKEMLSNDGRISLETSQVCRLCMSATNNECDANNVTNSNDYVLLQEMIKYYFPEMDLSDVNEPAICKLCLNSLKGFHEFLNGCREVEPLSQLVIPGTANICILELKSKKFVELGKSIIKREYLDAEHDVNPVTCLKNEDIQSIKCEELQIKDESDTRDELSESDTSESCNKSGKTGSLKRKMQIRKSTSKGRKNASSDDDMPRHRGLTKTFGCLDCTFKTDKKYIFTRHMVKHKGKSKVEMHKCALSPYKNKYNRGMPNDQLSHMKFDTKLDKRDKCTNFKCKICPYQTDRKSYLWRHNIVHKDKSEVRMHKCESCEYETKYKNNVKKHMRKHLDPKAERDFKCDKCPYETYYKSHLREHCMIHKDKSEVKMHKCENCEYETKYKSNIIKHMANNCDPNAERKFKCDKCTYETDVKASLRKHNLIHKDKSEVEMHKCEYCKYETKYKYYMINHMRKHRNSNFERKFKCDKCLHETDFKSSLSRHSLIHEAKSEVKMYKCDNCDFETKYRSGIILHMVKHRDPKAVKEFKCDKCSFETNRRSSLRSHKFIHRDKLDMKMHKCLNCEFETRHKHSMIQHMLKHRDPKAERIYKCGKCPYETDYKAALNGHDLTHKDKSEVKMHKCEHCEYETRRKAHLNRHMLTHRL